MKIPGLRVPTRYFIPALLFALALHPAAATDETATRNDRLEDVRARMREVQAGLEAARDESGALQEELQRAEQSAAAVRQELDALEADIRNREERLTDLRERVAARQAAMDREAAQLARQIRAAYMAGQEDTLKILLNQEDPAVLGRMLAYHDYFNQARLRRMDALGTAMDDLARSQVQIQDETASLEGLRQKQLARLGEMDRQRAARRDILARINAQIFDHDQELRRLARDEQELTGLLQRVQAKRSAVAAFEETTPFASLKGRLSWPLQGRIVTPFGAEKKGGKLRSHGVTMAAEHGTEVRAVSDGRVVFADWFRNLGLLLIVDHGGGYMSLYGHNEALLKKSGDVVAAGEVIGRAGDTGGAEQPGLYFEIRHDGSPQDPVQWCAR